MIEGRWVGWPGATRSHATLDGRVTLCGRRVAATAREVRATPHCATCVRSLASAHGAWAVESRSRPGLFHHVHQGGIGGDAWSCTCEAFHHASLQGGICWHIAAVQNRCE